MDVVIRDLGLKLYAQTHEDMLAFTIARDESTPDELWFLQHERVFTQGQAGKAEHVLMPGDIPVVQADRGGQVTYHGPGQLVVYLMVDINRLEIGPRELVSRIERAIVATLKAWNIESAPRAEAPGVYVGERKIASLGLRIKQGRSFHGLALNIDMDLEPFGRINPCGYAGMLMTKMTEETELPVNFDQVAAELEKNLLAELASGASDDGQN